MNEAPQPGLQGIEVNEVEEIEAAPAPRDYPDPFCNLSGGNAGTENDPVPDDLACLRGVAAAIGISAIAVAVALVLVALLFPRAAGAAQWHVALHGASTHFGSIDAANAERAGMCRSPAECSAARYERWNIGAGLRWQASDSTALQAGAYRNSYARTSRYLIADWTPLQLTAAWRAGIFAGVTDNYPYRDFAAVPIVGALLRWQGARASATLRVLPPVDGIANGGAAIEFGWRL